MALNHSGLRARAGRLISVIPLTEDAVSLTVSPSVAMNSVPVALFWGVCRLLCAQEARLTSRATSELTGLKWFIWKKPFALSFELTYTIPLDGEIAVQPSDRGPASPVSSTDSDDKGRGWRLLVCVTQSSSKSGKDLTTHFAQTIRVMPVTLWSYSGWNISLQKSGNTQVLQTANYHIMCQWHQGCNQRLCLAPKPLVSVSPGPTAHRRSRFPKPETLFSTAKANSASNTIKRHNAFLGKVSSTLAKVCKEFARQS